MPDLTNVQFARRHFFKAIGLGAAAVVAKATMLNSARASAGAYPPGYCRDAYVRLAGVLLEMQSASVSSKGSKFACRRASESMTRGEVLRYAVAFALRRISWCDAQC